jgi:hypothetical protein
MASNPRPRQHTFQHQVSDMKMPILVLFLVDGGEVPLTLEFKLLGSLLAYDLKDDCEIDARKRSAQGAFQAFMK